MNTEQWATDRVNELVSQIKFYVANGIDKETAVQMVEKETSIGKKYWEMVLEQVKA